MRLKAPRLAGRLCLTELIGNGAHALCAASGLRGFENSECERSKMTPPVEHYQETQEVLYPVSQCCVFLIRKSLRELRVLRVMEDRFGFLGV